MARVLDLFCCAGGATKGYQLAGHHVTGVDLDTRPTYCGDSFFQGDAIEFAREHATEFEFIHASPPCQSFSTITPKTHKDNYLNLIPETREVLEASGVPFIIENVVTAVKQGPMKRDLVLCGEMFGLKVIRHRVFEFGNGFSVKQPKHVKHQGKAKASGRRSRGTYTTEGYYFSVYGNGTDKGTTPEWQMAMGIDWMTDRHDLAEALPPAYTEYIAQGIK